MKQWGYVAIVGAFALSACTSNTVKDTLGLNRSAPDEYRVVSRPPLTVPPQFTLRPPANSDVDVNQPTASEKAKSMVLEGNGNDTKKAGKVKGTTSAESQFLKNAGADSADPKVRDALVEEHYIKQEKREDSPWWDIFSGSNEKKDPLVDAKKETDRIEKNQSEGQPVTTGDTPEVKAKDKGVLGKLLGY